MLELALEAWQLLKGDIMSIVNRLDDVESRDQFRWESDDSVGRDLRVFALLAGISEDGTV